MRPSTASPIGRAVKDLVHNRWVLGDRVFPRGPAPGALEHCRGPVRSAGVPLGPPRYVLAYVFGGFGAYAFHNRRSMPPPKKALSPASRAKADKRNEREKTKRAAIAAASGGRKSGKKRKATTDLTEEEEMPVSGGGSSSSAPYQAVLLGIREGELRIAEEKARFYERSATGFSPPGQGP